MGETVLGNRYEIIRKIGDGGMAFVYEAKDRLLNRTVAVKVLRPEFVDDEEFLSKFKREAEAVASLSHPNIVNVYDVGEDGRVHYIVMEFIDGQNLKEIIQNEGTLDEYTALDITKQIAMALSAAHKKGIVHRDIKPHNILISNEGRIVKVADFGIAKAVSNSTMTNIGSIIGSVHYFSPEQAKGKYVTSNADLYSLGIVLYEMLIGKVPFRGDSPISIALQHINDEIEFTQDEKINIPQSVRTIIKKLTEKSTVNRYQSAEELIEDIEYIEKNIDLDFIKEYDNYATQKIDEKDLNKSMKIIPPAQEFDEEEYYNDEYEDDEYFEEVEERPKLKRDKKKSKKRKQGKEDSPLAKKLLIVAAVVLALILGTQVYLATKFAGQYLFGSSSDEPKKITVPDVSGESMDSAQEKLSNLNLKVEIKEEYNADVKENCVIYQTPKAGTELQEGDTVTIYLSKGAKEGVIPNIVGMILGEAENILKENKLKLGNIKQEYSDTFKQGVVISQSPKSGSGSVEEGDKIDVVISKGPKPVETPKQEEDKKEEETPTPETPTTPVNPGGNDNGSNNNGSGSNNGGSHNNGGSGSNNGGSHNNGGSGNNNGSSNGGSSGGSTEDGGSENTGGGSTVTPHPPATDGSETD
ncbi:Stk1 family PASTA domain-containing Ser/Thr kinase [Romboutsia lituseburensis]|uniref:Stk1 family PASTA domain-containing Ser/Thr kinase n=1 Tax=Romboutsia lituseburensis TaxID=1537 RepID=UPI00215B72A0|nr:Stk1 family PASTA domain-containing Ser/Thr kinase [Romboutsia lituseburensis]MCR8745292.1 Stk1 family PASTA domain-containing Ser/Thr kinase [Romboutsia lituseburensis]